MKINAVFRWLYSLLLAATMVSLFVVLFITGPRVENSVLERRLETADSPSGMTYPIEVKGLTLYGTQSERLMDVFNHTAFFAFFGLVAIGLLSGQIAYRQPNRST